MQDSVSTRRSIYKVKTDFTPHCEGEGMVFFLIYKKKNK